MTSYKTALRAKGIKPIRKLAHTDKSQGGIELLPVAGVYNHTLELIRRDLRAAVIL